MAPLLLVAAPHVLPIKERLTSDEWQPGSLKARLTFRCIARELIRSKTGFSANKHFSKVLKKVACLTPHPVLPSGLQISLQDRDMEDLPCKILNKGGKKKKKIQNKINIFNGCELYKKIILQRHCEGKYCNALFNVHVGISAVGQEKSELWVWDLSQGIHPPPHPCHWATDFI